MTLDNKKLSITYRELFFFLYFAIMFGMRMWGVYEGNKLYGPLLIVGFLLWGVSVLMTKHTVAEYLVMAILLVIAVLVYLHTGEKGLLLYFTLMLGMKNIDVRKLFTVGILAGGSGLLCLTFLTSFGILEDVAFIQPRPPLGAIFRHSLGMPHPNTLSTSFIIIMTMIMYLVGYRDKAKVWIASAISAAYACYLFMYSASRTGVVITFGFLALNLFYAYRKKLCVLEKVLLAILFPAIWSYSILLPALASDELVQRLLKIDHTLMVRIRIGKEYLHYNKITPFGSRLVNFDTPYGYGIDLSQLYLLLNLGVVAFVVVSALYIMLIVDETRENRLSELVITVSFLLMGITDPFLYNISFKNLCFVFIGAVFYKLLDRLAVRMPGWANFELPVLGIGERELPCIHIGRRIDLKKVLDRVPLAVRWAVIIVSMVLTAAASLMLYRSTPEPEYALTDNSYKENIPLDLKGRTYTREEIEDIKAQGNIVLNYTDENELMYTYYSDEDAPVEGGFYSKNAALVEKIRSSVNLFFWGTVILAGIAYVTVAVGYDYGIKKRRGLS